MRQVKLVYTPERLRFVVVVQISLQTSKVEGQEYEQYAISILVSWEIKRMRMQLSLLFPPPKSLGTRLITSLVANPNS